MKKRKRKMKQSKLKCRPDVANHRRFIIVIAQCCILQIAFGMVNSNRTVTIVPHHFDQFDQHEKQPNLNYETEILRNSSKQSISVEDKKGVTFENNSLLISDDGDDLLAVETSSRLLTIGKAHTMSPPPYANEITNNNSNNLAANFTTFHAIQPTKLQFNDSHLLKLYRSPQAPLFINRSRQLTDNNIKLIHQPVGLKRLPSNIYLPPVGPPSLHFFSLTNRLNETVAQSSSAPLATSWQQSDSQSLNRTSPVQVEPTEGQVGRVESATKASEVEYEETVHRPANETHIPSTMSKSAHQFPSLINDRESENFKTEKKEFVQTLANGNYQRTNANSNTTWSQLIKQATESNVMESLMVTNRSMVSLLCDTNDMLIRLKFKQPFRGIVTTNLDMRKSCQLVGTGDYYYEFRVPLRDCGTRQEMPRLFINNIQIQFYKSNLADMVSDDDEVKTIICSYPIRPRAPPPPELPPGQLSDRIVELPPSEPARLVYYEPLFLISGLLLFSLTLLGLTTVAYVFSKRRKRRTSFSGASTGFSSSRIYKNSPAQIANNFVRPPLIGSPVKFPSHKSIGKRYQDDITLPKTKLKPARDHSAVSMRPNASLTDSLADDKAADESSVTTIEIPFSNNNKLQETSTKSSSHVAVPVGKTSRASEETIQSQEKHISSKHPVPTETNQDSAKRKSQSMMSDKKSSFSLVKAKRLQVSQPPGKQFSSSTTKTSPRQELAPRFGSLRVSLTSPSQFKRLQEIAGLFEKVLTGNKVEEKGETILVYKTDLNPSKYKSKILNQMDDAERQRVADFLNGDEIFRSLVVECTDRETFLRKLRYNPLYRYKFKPETWILLEEIFTDPNVASEGETSNINRLLSSPLSDQQYVDSAEVQQKSANHLAPLEHRIESESKLVYKSDSDNGNESVLAEADADQSEERSFTHHQDSLDESTNKLAVGGMVDRIELDSTTSTKRVNSGDEGTDVVAFNEKSVVRVSRLNSTRTTGNGGLTGTLINIDSVTNFTSFKDFSTYTKSSIEHTRYQAQQADESLPFVDDDEQEDNKDDSEKVGNYEYVRETFRLSPRLTDNRRQFKR